MKYFLLFMLMVTLKVSLCHYAQYKKCSHSRYFLNFFNHNEKFLLKFEKNKEYLTIENLMNYGKALQTHNKVIIMFLDDLMNSSKKFSFPLITVNMYLNNVSGHLNMIAQNDDDEKNNANNLLEGYKMIHFAVKEQLTDYIYKHCKNIPFVEKTVSFNPPIGKNEYTTTNLMTINNEFKDKILTKFELTSERNSYECIHPENILLYDIMTQQILTNKNNIIKIDNNQHIILNLLRFTPLNFKCSNGTRLTIQDVFEYIKYDFNSRDVLMYMKLVIGATFRPIAILIRNFLTLIQVASSDNSDCVKYWLKPNFIGMGQKIEQYVLTFISIGMLILKKSFMINDVLYGFNKALNSYIYQTKLSEIDIKYNNELIKLLSKFFINNRLYFTSDIALTNKNITQNNADKIKNEFENIIKKVDIYINDLNKWKKSLEFIVRTFKIKSFNVSTFKDFINFKVLGFVALSSVLQ
ncbi:uncharacterized protein LOC126900860 isoform X2 [Daktulosphaira vitifoliae]|uniref:uncharacterized protein LOC126900860 isoform X2 n=1 Tax=Daktulosphaira vitifoliae TaxID=58002 RepID=UPI0021AA7FAE|nr:uncharacterized protein LOC126900860 isoform X2 [Daktulosphaira vitifoliae]XP_050532797.1 uncharacterized protein LOC126900860 isoform X2 [Daktulosphaira vitifoliae]